ncbi:MAG: glycine zipper 2TM domain-containing protein [Erythrobacter sp.]
MKNFAAITAAGTLAILTIPAQAAEIAQPVSSSALLQSTFVSPLDTLEQTASHHKRKHRGKGRYNRGSRYDRYGRYETPRRLSSRDRVWRGRNGNYYCKRDNGTTGAVIGAGVGALAGRTVDTRGDRTLGTLVGAVAGGLLGRELTRGNLKCR